MNPSMKWAIEYFYSVACFFVLEYGQKGDGRILHFYSKKIAARNVTVCRAVRLFVTSMDGCSILREIMIDRIVGGREWAALYKISLKTLSPLIRTASFFGVCVSGYLLVRMIYFPANQIGKRRTPMGMTRHDSIKIRRQCEREQPVFQDFLLWYKRKNTKPCSHYNNHKTQYMIQKT